MKFLVIATSNSRENDFDLAGNNLNSLIKQLQAMIGSRTLESAYALISGGFVLIINAEGTNELATIIRSNPLFKTTHTQIMPIADAVDFLEGYAEHIKFLQ
jgi:hypothetical protein